MAGYGAERLRTIEVDESLAMRPDRLEEAIEEDRAAGLVPAFVTATVGTTSTTAVDPVPAIAEVCRRHGVWLHVDAAYAGIAALLPEMRWINVGLDLADSYCTNPHKWMLTNFDCTAYYVADRDHLIDTLTVLPEYLRNQASESGSVIDYRDWQIPLGRRFRALKLWFVVRSYGLAGLRAHVRNHIELADQFASLVESSPDFEVVTDHPFGLVCFRHCGGDVVNQRIMDTANRSGEIYLTHTRVNDRLTLRLAIGNPRTGRDDIEAAWRVIAAAASG
jgi:aromatic-L-amino-acid decarboxylase